MRVDLEQRVRELETALAAQPQSVELLSALGGALRLLERDAECEVRCRAALTLRPDSSEALRTLGGLLQLQGRYTDAITLAETAVRAAPQLGEGWLILGDAIANSGRPADAIRAYVRAAASASTQLEALIRIGKMERVLGRPEAAVQAFEAAHALAPSAAEPLYERGLLRLESGEFAQGWADYEARWRTENFEGIRGQVPAALVPLLTLNPSAEDLRGKRVLLIAEQGVGDQIMFASMIPDLIRTAASVVCVCEPRLLRLFRASFTEARFLHPAEARIDSNEVDVLLAMGSQGSAFRAAPHAFPTLPYLKPRPEIQAAWRERLGASDGRRRIGVSWRGGTPQTGRIARSLDLAALQPLLSKSDCEFFSLQYGDIEAELVAVNAALPRPIRSFQPGALDDFEDFAALLTELDAVVSVQNATVHLAGAVGVRCLTLLPFNPEWRYGRRADKMPWYGSVRLFRQSRPAEWEPVVEEVTAVL